MPGERIRVAIVGGGIGGLAAANALVRRGIDVMVYEQASALGEVGAGVFIYPNSLRQLERMSFSARRLRPSARRSVKVRNIIGWTAQWSGAC